MKQVSKAIKSFVFSSPFHQSTPHRNLFSKYVFLLLLVGFATLSSSFQKENLLSSSQNRLTKSAPFKGKFTFSFNDAGTGVDGTGVGSQIGRFTIAGQFAGTSTITAANGDQIFTTFTELPEQDLGNGIILVSLNNTITGGTGRFAGATGSFVIDALTNLNLGTGSATFDGTIKLSK